MNHDAKKVVTKEMEVYYWQKIQVKMPIFRVEYLLKQLFSMRGSMSLLVV